MKTYYAIQQAEEKRSADIYIFGDIVQDRSFESDVSATGIIRAIGALDVDTINVHINSYGGSVPEGWAIYNALREHPAVVNTYGDGFVASAAIYPFLAGNHRYASNLSAYYLHQVIEHAAGYAGDLRAAADEAEFLTTLGINAFVDSAGMDPNEVKSMMEKETWLTPEQALEYGIATAITQDTAPRHLQNAKRDIIQRFFIPAPTIQEQAAGLADRLAQMLQEYQEKMGSVLESGNTGSKERNKILQLFERSETK